MDALIDAFSINYGNAHLASLYKHGLLSNVLKSVYTKISDKDVHSV